MYVPRHRLTVLDVWLDPHYPDFDVFLIRDNLRRRVGVRLHTGRMRWFATEEAARRSDAWPGI